MPRTSNAKRINLWPGTLTTDNDVQTTPTTATTYSIPLKGPHCDGLMAFHIEWSVGLNGSFSIQYTIHADPNLATDADWVTDTAAQVIGDSLTVAGAAGKSIIFVGNVVPEFARIKWTHTSGSGNIWVGARVSGV